MIHARNDYNHIQDSTGKIKEDEPVFLLRAKDMLAPHILILWAEELISRGGDKAMAKMVTDHAVKMINWQEQNGCKLPDLPKSYNQDLVSVPEQKVVSNPLRMVEDIIERDNLLALIITSSKTGEGAHFFIQGDTDLLEQVLTAFMNEYPQFKNVIENALNEVDE